MQTGLSLRVDRRIRNSGIIAVIVALVLMCISVPAYAQVRHALVIGIDTYDNVASLQKARNDANAVSEVLAENGFEVTTLLDADRREMTRALSRFSAAVQPGDEAVFYFAGHGIEVQGRNYLLPADVPEMRPGDEVFLTSESLAADEILSAIQNRGARVTLLILDACRDNPFPAQGTRSLGQTRGLARVDAPEGAFVMFSAGTGQAALDRLSDDDPDPNSVFTRALLPLLSEPGLPIHEVARQLRREVTDMAASIGYNQRPAYYDEVTGDFILSTASVVVEPEPEIYADDPGEPDPSESDLSTETPLPYRDPEISAVVLAACESVASINAVSMSELRASDMTRAENFCRRAIETFAEGEPGYFRAIGLLGRVLIAQNRYDDAAPYLHDAAYAGERLAATNLGFMYDRGLGVEANVGESVRFTRMGAELGERHAMTTLGTFLESGTGVEVDYNEAFEWYSRAADLGDPRGMFYLGRLYARGSGDVVQDHVLAVTLFIRASEAGSTQPANFIILPEAAGPLLQEMQERLLARGDIPRDSLTNGSNWISAQRALLRMAEQDT